MRVILIQKLIHAAGIALFVILFLLALLLITQLLKVLLEQLLLPRIGLCSTNPSHGQMQFSGCWCKCTPLGEIPFNNKFMAVIDHEPT